VVTDEELAKLEPKASRDIEVTEFVPTEAISQQWYERPYYLGPDGDEKSYFALAEALNNRDREGVAHWVMRKKNYVGALRAEGDYLLLVTLRNAAEVISAKDLPKPAGRAPTAKELNMAKQLVGMLEDEFNPADYKDEYRERVMEFIEKKAKGKAPRLRAVKAKRKPSSLDSVLESRWCDCQMASALLVALCRARDIPARLCSGYLLTPATPSGHYWAEAWIDGAWRPFDSAAADLAAGGRDAAWRDYYFGRVDHRMTTQVLPRVFNLAPSVRLPPLWHTLQRMDGDAVAQSTIDDATGALVFRDRIAVQRGGPSTNATPL